ncbi:MAG TPA: translation initiation factor IF-2 [Gammaproteobacteria bacterium]|nr:translation initiation factor IF-2 [Gammaproteobacteria bacterium]
MADKSVEQLAETLSVTVDRLLQQMKEAGLPQSTSEDMVTDDNQQELLAHLKRSHGESEDAPKKITLKRRTLSTLKTSGGGRGRSVPVEVRKKRTYVRRGAAEGEEGASLSNKPASSDVSKISEDEARRRAAHVESESEAERRREEVAQKAAELAEQKEKQEQEQKAEADKSTAKGKAAVDPEESKVSTRKDKRDRHDLDDDELQQKKSKYGDRKRKVEELLEHEVEDLLSKDVTQIVEKDDSSTLALSAGARPKRPQQMRVVSGQHKFMAPTEEVTREVELGESITIQQLSQRMSEKASEVIKTLFDMGIAATINQTIDQDTAVLVVEEFGHTVKILDADAVEKTLSEELVYDSESLPRTPVVTVMGHVDHGKTSLLDYVRKSAVVDGEAGGITQHIGAYRVNTDHGEICFIDTPGHAAFTAMRARGANCTDIVILVVAADDGVMPQTEEAIAHSKGAGVPVVVAVNKIDVEGADPDRVKNELAAREVIPDDWGGDTQFVSVSAITGEGVDDLLEAVLLQAELLELTAVEDGPAQGVVIDSELDKGKGPVATLLVQEGTLSQGDIVVAGEQFGRVRALNDEHGMKIKSVGPATPVAILGLDGTPGAGDSFMVTKDEKKAREVAGFRKEKANDERLASPVVSLDNLLDSFGAEETRLLNIVVKADVRGSLEAIVSALNDIGNDEVKVNVVLSGVGGITESDTTYAVASEAVIFGFNVRADNPAKKIIESEGLDLRYYKVIYDLVDDVRAALSGMLSPEVREDIVGIAEVKEVFQSKKFGDIAGCMVTDGAVSRNKKIRVLRDNVVVYEGELESLRRVKDEVEDVQSGTECGIGVRNYNDVKVGDQIEVFDTREVAREL